MCQDGSAEFISASLRKRREQAGHGMRPPRNDGTLLPSNITAIMQQPNGMNPASFPTFAPFTHTIGYVINVIDIFSLGQAH